MHYQAPIETIAGQPVPWLADSPEESPIALGCRLALRRNLGGHRFLPRLAAWQRRQIQLHIAEAAAELAVLQNGYRFELSSLPPQDRHLLLERRLTRLSPAANGEGSSLFVSPDQALTLTTNETDHLVLRGSRAGASLRQLWQEVSRLDVFLGQRLAYVYDAELGYLTARPDDVGTGLRAGIVLHLPALLLADQMQHAANAVAHVGLNLQAALRDGDEVIGNLFELTNRSTLGESEEQSIDRLARVASDLVVQEKRARHQLQVDRPEWIADYVGRAYGMMLHARHLGGDELANLISALRLGLDLGMIVTLDRPTLNRLTMLALPAHLQKHLRLQLDTEERAVARARLVRERLQQASREATGKA